MRADVEGFDRLVTSSDPAVVIGTGPGEMTVGRDEWVTAFGQLLEMLPGLVLEPGALQASEEGTVGWAIDQPTWALPGGSGHVRSRMTAVLRNEGGDWRLVHAHFSVGVPDEEAIEA